jgi:hypothetical protein
MASDSLMLTSLSIVDKRRAGMYERGNTRKVLESIIEVLKSRKFVPCNLLREMMRNLYPDSVAIAAQDVTNMRFKVRRILDRMDKEKEEAGDFSHCFSSR